jgi:bifunctional UDP-N-acetylglucosamine pyrophosphorylase/glucosamine-1-phosphate N-acetyltransferase
VTETPPAAVVVLAAGEGKRMKSELTKVLHAICGRSLLGHVLVAAEPLGAPVTVVVVGHGREQVMAHLAEIGSSALPAVQDEQHGTGHAVRQALQAIDDDTVGTVVVLPGDAPLLTTETLERLLDHHRETSAAATVLTAVVPNPTGYGRVVRDSDGQVQAIVEERDADEVTRQVVEINTSVYAFDLARLRGTLAEITTDNAQGEEYLTDVIRVLVATGAVVMSVAVADHLEVMGVNDRVQLAAARRAIRDRIVDHWMRAGVTIVDPATTWMGVRVTLEADVTIHQNTQLHGATHIARMAEVGPDCTLRNTLVGEGATVIKSHCTGAEIGPEANVGPFAYLRPGTVLGKGAKAGAFVELKQAVVGAGSKVPHLSYVGDAEIGTNSNIGAGTIFVNYDGADKHASVIGDEVRVGSDTMLVAPVTIGDGAYTAAGSVITTDVPAGAIGVGRAQQRTIEGWVERRRPNSAAAQAARRAREQATMDVDPPSDAEHADERAVDERAVDKQAVDKQAVDKQGADE